MMDRPRLRCLGGAPVGSLNTGFASGVSLSGARGCSSTVARYFPAAPAPGGRFVFDHYVFNESWARAHDSVPRLLYASPPDEAPGILVWDTYRYDFAARTMHCVITVETIDAGGYVTARRHTPLNFSWFEVPAMPMTP